MSTDSYLPDFLEFAKWEMASGGPDPHLKIAAELIKKTNSVPDKLWGAACYVGPYEISTGSVIWETWPLDKVLASPDDFRAWIASTWKSWCIRRERRAARTVKKMGDSLLSAANYAAKHTSVLDEDFEEVWEYTTNDLRYFGRYAVIKFLETAYRGGAMLAPSPDTRPRGGWSPRTALALILDCYDDRKFKLSSQKIILDDINEITAELAKEMAIYQNVPHISQFDVEVLLCNFRQALTKKYPGRPQDTDLANYYIAKKNWKDFPFEILDLREKLFPIEVLGEHNGWKGPRENLEFIFPTHGYFWSDLVYDYKKTIDFSKPQKY